MALSTGAGQEAVGVEEVRIPMPDAKLSHVDPQGTPQQQDQRNSGTITNGQSKRTSFSSKRSNDVSRSVRCTVCVS